ncbi:MFS general substrate transporter [Rhizophagus irregularis]|uniref:MFS general substrate transporter n=1 Tax=Rhizophagus irregularis TaxID=588596 RepID=A0A2N1P3V3_9GLOM|nr:MFS general substrate transporter [Rhizophagus irregularis]
MAESSSLQYNRGSLLNQSETSIESTGSTKPLIDSSNSSKDWTKRKNSLILFVVSFTLVLSPMSATIFYPAIVDIREYFQTTELMVDALAAVFTLFMGTAPLFWGSYSDTFGQRRKPYIIAIALSIFSSIVCFISPNFWLLMLARVLQACGAAAMQCLGAGVISDIYSTAERGRAYGIYFLVYNFGEIGGPIIGGYLTEYFGWRFIFLFLSIFGVILFIMIFFCLPETLHYQSTNLSTTLSQSSQERTRTKFNPLSSFKLLRHPNVLLIILYISSIWLTTVTDYIIIPRIYSSQYHVSSFVIGLIFLVPGVGFMIGSIIGGKYSDYIISKFTLNEEKEIYPEIRLKSVWFICILVPIAFLAYGWFLEMNSKIYWPLISIFIGSFGTLFIVSILSVYLVDSNQNNCASVIALSEFVPAFIGGLCQLISFPLQNALGVGWMFTLLVAINSLCSLLIIIVYLKGNYWRIKYNTINSISNISLNLI